MNTFQHMPDGSTLITVAALKQQVGRWPSKLLPCNDFHFLEVAGLVINSSRVISIRRTGRPAKTVIDFPETGRHNPSQTQAVRNRSPAFLFSRRVGATS
jgi:hypothetical protein